MVHYVDHGTWIKRKLTFSNRNENHQFAISEPSMSIRHSHHEESGIETRRYSCSFSITQLSKPARDRLWPMLKTLAHTQHVTVFSGCYFIRFFALLARAQGVYLNEHF